MIYQIPPQNPLNILTGAPRAVHQLFAVDFLSIENFVMMICDYLLRGRQEQTVFQTDKTFKKRFEKGV
jgi:hypothetical protein